MQAQKFRRLAVWNKGMDLVEEVYAYTQKFPRSETYGLTAQLRRAALSIPLNIAEGSCARSDAEFNRFLTIAMGSLYEILCGVEIAGRLLYLDPGRKGLLLKKGDELGAMLSGLKKYLTTED